LKTVRKRIAARTMIGLLLFALAALTASLQVIPAKTAQSIWNATFGGAYTDVAYCVQQTSDSGYIVAGFTESLGAGLADSWLVKTDSNGNMQWNRTYGGASVDETYCVRQASDGGYIVAGFTKSFGSGNADFWLVKTEVDGALRWSKTYGGIFEDHAYCVQQTSDMGYIMAGFTESFGAGGRDFWLVKTDSSGNMQWNKTYGGTGSDRAFSVFQTSDGGYIIAGETDSIGSGSSDFWMVKTDSVGTAQWNKTYGGTNYDVARSVLQTSDGEYIMVGWTNSFGAGGSDFWLVKTDGFGNQIWSQAYGGMFDEEAYLAQQTSDGGYVIAGSTTTYGLGGWDFWWVKTDANGIMRWNQANGGSADEKAYSVQQTSDGGYIFAGSTESYGAGLADFWVTKNPACPQRPPEEGYDIAIISVLPSRNLIGEGSSMSINVSVENQGTYQATTMISVYANTTLIEESPIDLGSAEIAVIPFTWLTSGFARGSYTISAVASQVGGETDTADNTFVDGKVKVTIVGDVQGDGKVDVFDLLEVGNAFGSDSTKSSWNPYCDFNNDNKVDTIDLSDLSENYGETSK